MEYAHIFVLLLSFVFGLGLLARRLSIPYPILFVLGGLLISFFPYLHPLKLDPEFIFFVFLPPLLYMQAFNTSWRDFRSELRPILLLAIGLVLATTVTVAYVSHWIIPDFPLAAGFVLGAIVSPPDAIAASAIAQRLGLPRRVVTILEGESLVNDATSLLIFRVALAAIGTVAPIIDHIWWPGEFIYMAGGGIAIGLAIGWFIGWLREKFADEGSQILLTISLLTPFSSYLVADKLNVSGVLAVVATGLYLGWRSPEITTASARLQAQSVWDIIIYLLNGMVFVLIGLQLPGIVHDMRENPVPHVFGGADDVPQPIVYAIVINVVCILVRIAWIFPGAYLPHLLSKHVRKTEVLPDWRQVFIISWCGMRGVVSLATALALNGYENFPRAHLVQFIAFSVIFTSLVFQGLTLPSLIRYFGVGDDGSAVREEKEARLRMSEAALEKIEEVRQEKKHPETAVEQIDQLYRERGYGLTDNIADELGWSERRHHLISKRRLHRLMIATQRRVLINMRRNGHIGDDVLHKIEHELDLEEARLKV